MQCQNVKVQPLPTKLLTVETLSAIDARIRVCKDETRHIFVPARKSEKQAGPSDPFSLSPDKVQVFGFSLCPE